MKPVDEPGLLATLAGKELEAVTFVRNYVQLQFHGALLNCLVDPVVRSEGIYLKHGMSGYRDALCRQINASVSSATEHRGDRIVIEFSDGVRFELSLRDEDRVGPEAVTLQTGTGEWNVW
jgi:hypothetical protein